MRFQRRYCNGHALIYTTRHEAPQFVASCVQVTHLGAFTPIECLPDDCLVKSYPVDLPLKDGTPVSEQHGMPDGMAA